MQTSKPEAERDDPVVILGEGEYRYRVLPYWAKVPRGMEMINFGPGTLKKLVKQ